MPPLTVGAIVSLVASAVQEFPVLEQEFKTIFAKKSTTPTDWQALHDKIAGMTYESLVPDTDLPKPVEPPPPQAPG